ncbi:MAG: acyltransferase [Candidatus Lokiarchaeota archaeon]|nr:acyltransferase [Candidatus Lokiarchaeota archaeon]
MKNRKQFTELVLVEAEKEKLEESGKSFFQIDFLKAAMIILVIFDHMVSWGVKSEIGVTLWERISIPVFLVIMGFNMGISFQRKGVSTLKELYSWSYFKSKILRYIVPFLVLYGFSTLIGLILYQFDITAMYRGQYYPEHGFIQLFTGILPFWGPGNWFIPVIFGSIVLFPLVYWVFTKKPVLTLILCFAIEIIMQLIVFFFLGQITSWEESYILSLFMTSFPFYLSAIGLGLWFSFNRKPFSRRNLFIWILFPISLIYMIYYQFFGFQFRIGGVPLLRGDYHFLIFPYSAVIFLLVMMVLPQKSDNKFSRAISLIGKSTYHIFLTQMLGYGMISAIWGTHYIIDVGFTIFDALNLIYAWIVFISFGVLWYKMDQEKNIIRRLLYYVNFFLVLAVIVYSMFVWLNPPFIVWVPIPLIIILIYGGAGLIINFALKKPLKTTTLAIWTSFLVYDFIITILYLKILPPTEYLIQNITIGTFLLFAIISTVLDYTLRK